MIEIELDLTLVQEQTLDLTPGQYVAVDIILQSGA